LPAPPSHFDTQAATWDTSDRLKTASAVTAAMRAHIEIPVPPGSLLDYGAGTGLVTFALAPDFRRVLAVDSSEGMRRMLEQKRAEMGLFHVEIRDWDLERDPPLGETFDVSSSSMTLHHVRDTALAARTLRSLLRPGGQIALVDLDQEDGSFHKDNAAMGVRHFGFRRADLNVIFKEAGFSEIAFETAHEVERQGPDGPRKYPLFLLTARAR
jgi:SAM-dependent methyltransferase